MVGGAGSPKAKGRVSKSQPRSGCQFSRRQAAKSVLIFSKFKILKIPVRKTVFYQSLIAPNVRDSGTPVRNSGHNVRDSGHIVRSSGR